MNARKAKTLIRKMIKRDHEYGCGFYGDPDWNAAYDALAEMAGVGKAWRDKQERKQDMAHRASLKKSDPLLYERYYGLI